ncbi:MAG: bile acid:sodium symporter family protein [Phycisphaerales bacterium]|nr:MAG: bile acid:sodium symporter family protein [Phycisphaerales bacterium]
MLKKALSFYTRYFAVWVVLCGAGAYLWPGPVAALSPGMNWFFALTMFGIGVVLEVEDFRRIASNPVIVFIGSAAQFSIMPLGAYAVSRAFGLEPEFAVGLVLTGSAPGAMASNVMSYIARADTAYSVSLTAVSTLLCPLLTPGLTYVLAGSMLKVPFWKMVLDVLCTVIVPLFAGFGVRHYFKEKVERILPVFPAISVTFIIFICSLVIALNRGNLGRVTGVVIAAAVLLNVYGLAGGYGVGRLFRMGSARRRTLAIEIGMQNAGLGTKLAIAHFGKEKGPLVAVPAAIFVFVCIITASLLAALWQRRASASAVGE